MNLTELYANLRQDPAYVEAEENLRFTLDIANSILSARLAKGWSQRELAERVGTRQANISRIECGVANPTLDLISRILRAHGWQLPPAILTVEDLSRALNGDTARG